LDGGEEMMEDIPESLSELFEWNYLMYDSVVQFTHMIVFGESGYINEVLESYE